MTVTSRISRRQFGRLAAIAAASPLASIEAARDHHTRQAADPKTPHSAEQSQEVEAKLSNIIRKYGNRLSHAETEHLRKIIAHNEVMLASVRSFPLRNGDPPASTLRITFESAGPANKGKD